MMSVHGNIIHIIIMIIISTAIVAIHSQCVIDGIHIVIIKKNYNIIIELLSIVLEILRLSMSTDDQPAAASPPPSRPLIRHKSVCFNDIITIILCSNNMPLGIVTQ